MNQNAGLPPDFWATFIVCFGVFVLVAIIIGVLFLLNLHWTLSAVREDNRELSPGKVWLALIPIFSTFYVLYMVPRISNSLEREFQARGRRTSDEGFARTAGMIWAWGGIVSLFLSLVQNGLQFAGEAPLAMLIGLLSLPVSIGILVCFILYWIQTYQYRKRLVRSSDEADYDDQYDRPGRGDQTPGRRDPDDDFDRDRPRRDDLGR